MKLGQKSFLRHIYLDIQKLIQIIIQETDPNYNIGCSGDC